MELEAITNPMSILFASQLEHYELNEENTQTMRPKLLNRSIIGGHKKLHTNNPLSNL
jgi:hypothetical protein